MKYDKNKKLIFPSGRSKALDESNFGVVYCNILGKSNLYLKEVVDIVFTLKPENNSIYITCSNEFKFENKNKYSFKYVVKDYSFIEIHTKEELTSLLENWKAERFILSFFSEKEAQDIPKMISESEKLRKSIIGIEEDFLLGFGSQRITIVISDSHNSIEIWGSKEVLDLVWLKI